MTPAHRCIIWAGPSEGSAYRALRVAIRRRGLRIVTARAAEDVTDLVEHGVGSVVVALDHGSRRWSRDVAEALRHACRRVVLFVIVERSDFAGYYDLMEQGANYYYQLNEGPRAISHAIEWGAIAHPVP